MSSTDIVCARDAFMLTGRLTSLSGVTLIIGLGGGPGLIARCASAIYNLPCYLYDDVADPESSEWTAPVWEGERFKYKGKISDFEINEEVDRPSTYIITQMSFGSTRVITSKLLCARGMLITVSPMCHPEVFSAQRVTMHMMDGWGEIECTRWLSHFRCKYDHSDDKTVIPAYPWSHPAQYPGAIINTVSDIAIDLERKMEGCSTWICSCFRSTRRHLFNWTLSDNLLSLGYMRSATLIIHKGAKIPMGIKEKRCPIIEYDSDTGVLSYVTFIARGRIKEWYPNVGIRGSFNYHEAMKAAHRGGANVARYDISSGDESFFEPEEESDIRLWAQ